MFAQSSAVRRETLDSCVGPIALIWNTDEPLPLNVDVSMSTDVFIFDATGKEVRFGLPFHRRSLASTAASGSMPE